MLLMCDISFIKVTESDQTILLRAKLIHLAEGKEIKQKKKYLETAPEEELKAIMKGYQDKKLQVINYDLSDAVIKHGAWALEGIGLIDSGAAMDRISIRLRRFGGTCLMRCPISPLTCLGLVSCLGCSSWVNTFTQNGQEQVRAHHNRHQIQKKSR